LNRRRRGKMKQVKSATRSLKMLSFEKWKVMDAKRRQKWLSIVESSDADEEDRELLSNIAEPLRRVDFELVEGWEHIQNVYKRWSTSDIEKIINGVLNKLLEKHQGIMEKVNEQLDNLRLENQKIKEENAAIRQAISRQSF
jgi:hypothetical protein